MVAKEEGGGGRGLDCELGSAGANWYIETGLTARSYVQHRELYSLFSHNGKEYETEYMYD